MEKEDSLTIHEKFVLMNSREWHLYRIMDSTDSEFEFGAVGSIDPDKTTAPLILRPSFLNLMTPVNLTSDNLPRDVAVSLRETARRLLELSKLVDKVRPETYTGEPLCYVIRGSGGQVEGKKLLLFEASRTANFYEEICSDDATITPESLADHPEQMELYQRITNGNDDLLAV